MVARLPGGPPPQTPNQELERRGRTYRGQRPRPELTGKVVIVVDDGLATGRPCGRRWPRSAASSRPGSWSRCRSGPPHLPEAGAGCRGGRLRHHAGAVGGRRAGLLQLRADDRRGGLCPARRGPDNQRQPSCRWLTGSSCLGQPPASALLAAVRWLSAGLFRGSDPPPEVSPGVLGSGGCNEGRPANVVHRWWCLPKDPPGSFSCLGAAAMPERTLCGVRVWWLAPSADRGH